MPKTTEQIKFKLIRFPCCGQLLCWINPRLPNFCPECGKQIWISLHKECIMYSDEDAFVQIDYKIGENWQKVKT